MLLRKEGTYFSRIEHGSHKVVADSSGFKVFWPSGPQLYPSARQTLIAITNGVKNPGKGCKDPKVTFDRYFRQTKKTSSISVMDVITSIKSNAFISVSKPQKPLKTSESISVEKKLGIDLSVYHMDVRRLFYAGFSKKVCAMGYDPEEVLQEIYAGILVRNGGKCPHDPSISSLGHYVHMVSNCILSNYNRKHSRVRSNELVGYKNESGEIADFATHEIPVPPRSPSGILKEDIIKSASVNLKYDPKVVAKVVDLMSLGHTKSEIVRSLGLTPSSTSKIMKEIRVTASKFV